jgi:hypothetical protein
MFEFEGRRYEMVEGECEDCAFYREKLVACVAPKKIWECNTPKNIGKIAKLVEGNNGR